MSSVETEPPPPHPSPRGRRRSAAFIAAFILVQFVVPLTYLTRDDPTDERFTWRLPPETRQPKCEASAEVENFDGSRERLSLEALIHRDWIEQVESDRRAVIEAFLRNRCESSDALEVTLVNRCESAQDVREYRLRCGSERPYQTPRTAAR